MCVCVICSTDMSVRRQSCSSIRSFITYPTSSSSPITSIHPLRKPILDTNNFLHVSLFSGLNLAVVKVKPTAVHPTVCMIPGSLIFYERGAWGVINFRRHCSK
jgi:hypothetical protein